MNVIPLNRPQRRSDVRIALRRDLRTNVIASGAAQPLGACADDPLAAVRQTLTSAQRAWFAAGLAAPLSIAPHLSLYADAAGALALAVALQNASCTPRSIDIEVSEAELAHSGLTGVERLRARGFGIAIAVDPECPLPLGQRERALFSEYLVPAPQRVDPYLACEGWETLPLARRVFAAQASGIAVTALGVEDKVWARALLNAGFSRAEGGFAGLLDG